MYGSLRTLTYWHHSRARHSRGERHDEVDPSLDRRCNRLPGCSTGLRPGACRSVADSLRLRRRRGPGRHRALLGHDGVRGQEAAADCELLPHPPCGSLHDLGHRLSGRGRRRDADGSDRQGLARRAARAAEDQAGADQLCRHQPLSRRSHRPGGFVPASDSADRSRRLGCAQGPDALGHDERSTAQALAQRRRQGGAGRERQRRVRRRHASSCWTCRDTRRAITACW